MANLSAFQFIPYSWNNRPVQEKTLAYERLVCQSHGLIHPDGAAEAPTEQFSHFLGFVVPWRSEANLRAVADRYVHEKRDEFKAEAKEIVSRDGLTDRFYWSDLYEKLKPRPCWGFWQLYKWDPVECMAYLLRLNGCPLTYDQYLSGIRPSYPKPVREELMIIDGGTEDKPQSIPHKFPLYLAEDWGLLSMRQGGPKGPLPTKFTPDPRGYLHYLDRLLKPKKGTGLAAFLTRPIPAFLPEETRKRHTYVTGTTGSGKTELLKLLIHSTVHWRDGAVVVLDPHGDMAEQIARWPEFIRNDRLVYIDPFLADDRTPVLNPFDQPHTPAAEQALLRGLQEMLGRGEGANLTLNMQNILLHCIPALFAMKGTRTLADLLVMMGERNMPLVEQAKKVLPKDMADYFETDFRQKQFQQTRLSISTKLRLVLNRARNLFVGQSTVNLEELVHQRKVIVFNLARGRLGAEASEAFGRFVISQVFAMALNRANQPDRDRVPVHVFVDECQTFMTDSIPDILEECRKYKVALTLSQQFVGQGVSTEVRRSILGNTNLKFTGTNSNDTYEAIARATETPIEELKQLRDREFQVWTRGQSPFVLQTASHLADRKYRSSDDDWQRLRAAQLERYYRPIGDHDHAAADDADHDDHHHRDNGGSGIGGPKYPV